VLHAKDAMWHADAYLELTAAVAGACAHNSQLAQDLEILASQEFGVARLAEHHSRASALMPQKRNPYALAVVRAMAGTAAGELAGLLVTLHTGSARTDHFHVLNGSVPRLLDEAVAVARLMARVVEGLEIDEERLAEAARRGFTTAADVADVVAREAGVDYRTAHHVVGWAVRQLLEAGSSPDGLTPELLARAGREAAGVEVVVAPEVLADALDPRTCALTRLQRGSSSPAAMAEMLADCRAQLDAAREWSDAAARREAEGRARLSAAADAISGAGPAGGDRR
jgi:argininosuccinate lyase